MDFTPTDLSISEIAPRILRRQLSCVELVRACLARIDATEEVSHAFAEVLADAALKNAAERDRELQHGHWRGPLHGIPIGVKDVIWTRDGHTEAGSRVLAGHVASEDAAAVRRLREDGAIILGKTVTHEFAYGQNIPLTRNPWAPEMYPGGSSVGSGVATAVGSVFAAIGTDTGGSVRVPAAVNGLVGLKPTFGRVSRRGCIPLSTSLDHVGPLTRSVEDCALLLQAMAGHDAADRASATVPVPDFRAQLDQGVGGARIGLDTEYFLDPGVTSEVRGAVLAVVDLLRNSGAEIVDCHVPELELSALTGMTLVQVEASSFHRSLLRERGDLYAPGTRLMLEFGSLLPGDHYVAAARARSLVSRALQHVYLSHRLDAMIAPAIPWPTVRLEESPSNFIGSGNRVDLSGLVRYGMVGNVTGVPVLTMRCAFSTRGLPIAVSFFGRPFCETQLFRIGRVLEANNETILRPGASGLPHGGAATR